MSSTSGNRSVQLLVNQPAPPEHSADTCFGGVPVLPAGTPFTWPTCAACDGAMQFLGRVLAERASDRKLLLLFMCQNDPGMCNDWDADAGGNAAFVVAPDNLVPVQPPAGDALARPARYGAGTLSVDATDYDAARDAWRGTPGRKPRDVLGQLFGKPGWIQGDQTPSCDCCRQPMTFVAQLEQGPDWETEMNFGGGGCAYVFLCSTKGASAKLLWQC